MLALFWKIVYTKQNTAFLILSIFSMQYKIPVQIENEDSIFLGLSFRQLWIIMWWWGIAYGLFTVLEPRLGSQVALIFVIPLVIIGIIIALLKISEMTFLPIVFNSLRLTLNAKKRLWSKGTDSYEPGDIGAIYIKKEQKWEANLSFAEKMKSNDEIAQKIKNL